MTFTAISVPGVKRSREMLFELLDAKRQEGFPTEETVVLGFSQGCLMTMEVGARYPHKFAGLVGISGLRAGTGAAGERKMSPVAKEQRFLVTHGFQDPVVPFAATRDQIKLLKAAGLNIAWHEFNKAHNIAGEPEVKLIRDFIKDGFQQKA